MSTTWLRNAASAATAALAFTAFTAHADPGYYVVTAYPDAGLRALDVRYWSTRRPGQPEVQWPELGFAYGVTSRWTSELYASWVRSSRTPTRLSSWNWQNDFLLTQGEWPLDIALHTQLVRAEAGERAWEFGPALQTDFGRLQVNANVFFHRRMIEGQPATPTELRYQWQLRHRTLRGLHLGAQGLGQLGEWNDWAGHAQQSHRAGPALFTTLGLADGVDFHLQAASLYGRVNGRSARMFTLRARTTF